MSGRNYGEEKKSLRDGLFDLLSDLKWHTYRELSQVAGLRYSARILELKRLGYQIEDEELSIVLDKMDGKRYRLTSLEPQVQQEKRVKVYLEPNDAKKLLDGVMPRKAKRAIRESYNSYQANKEKL